MKSKYPVVSWFSSWQYSDGSNLASFRDFFADCYRTMAAGRQEPCLCHEVTTVVHTNCSQETVSRTWSPQEGALILPTTLHCPPKLPSSPFPPPDPVSTRGDQSTAETHGPKCRQKNVTSPSSSSTACEAIM